MVAVIGLGRASDGSLLSSSSEDPSDGSGYIAVAVENSRLYGEQKQHTEELAVKRIQRVDRRIERQPLAVDEDDALSAAVPFEEMMSLSRERAVGQVVEETDRASPI
jgi:hypothetical protein